MKVIRKYLLKDDELLNLLQGKNIYLVEKPQKIKCNPYIVYNYKPLGSGIIKDYQITFYIVGKKLKVLLDIQKQLINLLDEIREPIIIKDKQTIIKHSKLLNGGGIIKNEDTGNYEIVVYFLCKI